MILVVFRAWLSGRWPVLRLVRVFRWGGAGGRPAGPWVARWPGLGGSGRGGRGRAGGFEQAHPFVLSVQAFGQVHSEVAAAVARDAGGDADEAGADGRASGFRAEGASQAAGGAGQVMADGGQGQPRGVSGEMPGWQVSERAVGAVCEHLLDDGVVSVVRLRLDLPQGPVVAHGVVPPNRDPR